MKNPYTMPLLTSELLDQIIFSMEDQESETYLDLQDALVVSDEDREDEDDDDRYLSLPEWTSADGFHLMEMFASRIRNPYYKMKLSQALSSRKGVFRAFKDVLEEVPPLQSSWYGFKQHEMEKVVTRWYREEEGALALDDLDDETPDEGLGDQLLTDFSLEFRDDGTGAEKLYQTLLGDMGSYTKRLVLQNMACPDKKRYVVAVGPDGDVCALLVFTVHEQRARVLCYGVEARMRGIGLFRLMFDTFSRQLAREKVSSIAMDFSGNDMAVADMFVSLPVMELQKSLSIPVSQYIQAAKNSEQALV